MNVSVIIPTYNGAQKLPGILQSLQHQTVGSFEVIVVVDGSTDNTIEVLHALQHNIPFRIIEQENKGRAAVRNRGAFEAQNDLLLFFDDDMLLSENCIQKHIEHHKLYPNSVLTGGLEEPPKQSEFSKFKAYLNKKWSNSFKQTGSIPIAKENPYLTAGNLSISATLFRRLHGFDERLTDAEDYDLAIRAVQEGIALFYNAEAFAWHNEEVSCLVYIKRLRQYSVAQENLLRLKPSLYAGSVRKTSPPKGIKGVLFQQFCSKWWIQSVDHDVWIWLPPKIRFKLYDLIVTANGSFFPNKVAL